VNRREQRPIGARVDFTDAVVRQALRKVADEGVVTALVAIVAVVRDGDVTLGFCRRDADSIGALPTRGVVVIVVILGSRGFCRQ